ncbi:MAG: histidine phosphatase family protein, partial [Odoribacter sp.]|nr:histidine phosphatase family protein [Odoribacter sp.]
LPEPALQRWYVDWIHTPAGGAESYEEQCARVAEFLRELRHSGDAHPCIFTHRGVIACALVYAGICSVEDSFNEDIPYGSLTDIEI